MQESPIYQDILEESREVGLELGLKQGRERAEQAKARQIALNLLQEEMAAEVISRVTDLSIKQIQSLQE